MLQNKLQRRWLALWMVVALFIVGAAYSNSFENGFHFDDFHTVTDNPAVRSMGNLSRFFTDTSTFSVLPANRTYRPFVSASLALDYTLAGGKYEPFWFHLSTFVWFVVLLALLYLLYEGIFARGGAVDPAPWLALIAAAWFGLHPAIAETVNYVIQRGDLYCTLGCVAALTLWARLPDLRKFGLYLVPLAAALLSKPPAAVFPLLLLLYVYFFEAEGSQAMRWKKAAVAMLPALDVVALGMWLQSAMTPKSYAPTALDAGAYRLTQPYVLLRYFGALFLPIHLNADTDLMAFDSFNGRAAFGLVFLILLLVAIAFTARRKTTYPIAYGLLWFLITELPTSLYALSEVENDHRMFFAFAGLILAVVWAAWLGLQKMVSAEQWPKLRPGVAVVVALLLGAYAWGVHVRNGVWKNEETLWKDDVEKSPHNGRGLMNYGLTLMSRGDYAGALALFQRALEFTPNYSALEINMAIASGGLGDNAGAERHFQRAISLAPASDESHTFYARWLTQIGRPGDAAAEAQKAVALDPQRPMGHEQLVVAYEQSGNYAAARQAAQETLAYVPGDPVALEAMRLPANAPAAVPSTANPASTAQLSAANAAALINQSLVLIQAGKYEDSIKVAQAALKVDPKNALAWNNIAAANESLKRWDNAIAAAQKAIALDPGFQLAKNNLAWSLQQKKLAQAGK